jgi:2-hydroxychromene-2-carboxylate isomerase
MHIDFLFDYASPYSYLADATLAKAFPGAEVRYHPVYLRGLEMFAKGMPFTMNKVLYMAKDLARIGKHARVPLRIPDEFPVNGVYALRGALWAQDTGNFAVYNQALFRAAWAENRPISNKAVVIEVAQAAGLDSAAVAAALDDAAVKERLRAATAAYEAKGVFGVPTFFVGDEWFWGQDRMEYVWRAYLKYVDQEGTNP